MKTYVLVNPRFDYVSGAVLMFAERGGPRSVDLWKAENLRLEQNRILNVPDSAPTSSVTVHCTDVEVRRRDGLEIHPIPQLSFVTTEARPVASGQSELPISTGHATILHIEVRNAGEDGAGVALLGAGPPSVSLETRTDRQGSVRFLVVPGWYSLVLGGRPRPLFEITGAEAEVMRVVDA